MKIYNLILERLSDWHPAENASVHITRLGGLTNLNYAVETANHHYVFHIAGKHRSLLGINSYHEYQSGAIAASLGVGPDIVFYDKNKEILVTHYIPGHELNTDKIGHRDRLAKITKKLHTIHNAKSYFPGVFLPFKVVKDYYSALLKLGVKLPSTLNQALAELTRIEQCYQQPRKLYNCHNDLLAGNLIETEDENIHIIDWEYAGVGDRCFDLANFAAHFQLDNQTVAQLAALYCGQESQIFCRRILLMIAVSNLREALWGFIQTAISQLDIDYREYAHCFLCRYFENIKDLEKNKQLIFTPDSE